MKLVKQCSKCKNTKELSDFPKSAKNSLSLRSRCKACCSENNKAYHKQNATRVKVVREMWLAKNEKHMQQYYREYATKNREKKNRYYIERRNIDLNFRLAYLLRSRLYSALKGQARGGSAVDNLGCSIPEFRAYIETKFQPGMTWETYGKGLGKWSLDHILPLIRFDLSDPEQIKQVCHYTNMQPMWFTDNVRKGDKLDYNLSTSARQPVTG